MESHRAEIDRLKSIGTQIWQQILQLGNSSREHREKLSAQYSDVVSSNKSIKQRQDKTWDKLVNLEKRISEVSSENPELKIIKTQQQAMEVDGSADHATNTNLMDLVEKRCTESMELQNINLTNALASLRQWVLDLHPTHLGSQVQLVSQTQKMLDSRLALMEKSVSELPIDTQRMLNDALATMNQSISKLSHDTQQLNDTLATTEKHVSELRARNDELPCLNKPIKHPGTLIGTHGTLLTIPPIIFFS